MAKKEVKEEVKKDVKVEKYGKTLAEIKKECEVPTKTKDMITS
jgi:hypothetical protein